MNSKEFLKALDNIVIEKGIDKEVVYEAMELALTSAYKKNFNSKTNVKVLINRETGEIKVYSYLTVVPDEKPDDYSDNFEVDEEGNEIEEDIFNPETEIKLSDARREDKSLNVGDTIDTEVTPKDFGNEPLAGIAYQRELEKLAYTKGRGQIPLQLYKDFKNDRITTNLGTITPSIKGKYTFANLNEILPEYISEAIKEAMTAFDKKINGYANEDTILLGVESRTSSPVRIERNENGLSNILGVYPCGEGSGYAGGITTAAIDGIKTAENIAKEYA